MRFWALLSMVCLAGCKPTETRGGKPGVRERVAAEKSAKRVPVLGERRIEGDVQELRVSPDRTVVTVLVNGKVPQIRGAPPTMYLGELWASPVQAGSAERIATNVSSLPGGWFMTADSRWLVVIGGFEPTQHHGELLVQDLKALGAERHRVAAKVSYAVTSDDSQWLAYVEEGVLHVGKLPAGPFRQVAGEVATADFSPEGNALYLRRRFVAGGGLFQVALADASSKPLRIVDYVGDYLALKNGKQLVVNARAKPSDGELQLFVVDVATRATRKLADDASRFRVSRDGKYIAWRTIFSLQEDTGALFIAELGKMAEPRQLGEKVKDFEFSPDSSALLYRENFKELVLGGRDAKPNERRMEKVGDLYRLELPDGAPKLIQRACPNFLYSADGKTLAFTARIEQPEVTRRLLVLGQGQKEPRVVKEWIYEYQFRPQTDELYVRADCTREGRSCKWLAVSATSEAAPRTEGEGVFGARFSPDGQRAVLAFAHLTDATFDLAVKDLSSGQQTMLDQYVEWPAMVVGEQGQLTAYLVKEKHRSGLYIAPLTGLAPPVK